MHPCGHGEYREYWKPIWNILEGSCELLLVNAQHVKRVPGRKTDVSAAEWLADLLPQGLLQASFIPPVALLDRRDLTRQRAQLVRDRARVVHRIHQVRETANSKLSSVATNITGLSCRNSLAALVAERLDPTQLNTFSPDGCGTNCRNCSKPSKGACASTIGS